MGRFGFRQHWSSVVLRYETLRVHGEQQKQWQGKRQRMEHKVPSPEF